MKTWRGLRTISPPLKGSVLTIGNFDGLHLGHRHLLSQVVEKAKELDLPTVAMVFDPHPAVVLRPEAPRGRLSSLDAMGRGLAELGISNLVIEPFTRDFSLLTGEEFLKKYVMPALQPKCVMVGHDFQF